LEKAMGITNARSIDGCQTSAAAGLDCTLSSPVRERKHTNQLNKFLKRTSRRRRGCTSPLTQKHRNRERAQ
jgi:hypothetical protein